MKRLTALFLCIAMLVLLPGQTGNWLPVNGDDFHLYMRIYTPDMEAVEAWTAPVITMIK